MDPRVDHLLKTGQLNEKLLSTIGDIFSLFSKSSTGGQESINFGLQLRANFGIEEFNYYRFQPILDSTINTELDNSDPAFLQYMADTATQAYANDSINITTFLNHLTL